MYLNASHWNFDENPNILGGYDMRKFLIILLLALGQVFASGHDALADFLSDNRGQWEGTGVLESGFEWPIYVKFLNDTAQVYTPDDGCEAVWRFEQITQHMMKGWEDVTVGADRCYVGLEFVVTRYDDTRLEVNWFTMHGVFVAEAVLWRVQ